MALSKSRSESKTEEDAYEFDAPGSSRKQQRESLRNRRKPNKQASHSTRGGSPLFVPITETIAHLHPVNYKDDSAEGDGEGDDTPNSDRDEQKLSAQGQSAERFVRQDREHTSLPEHGDSHAPSGSPSISPLSRAELKNVPLVSEQSESEEKSSDAERDDSYCRPEILKPFSLALSNEAIAKISDEFFEELGKLFYAVTQNHDKQGDVVVKYKVKPGLIPEAGMYVHKIFQESLIKQLKNINDKMSADPEAEADKDDIEALDTLCDALTVITSKVIAPHMNQEQLRLSPRTLPGRATWDLQVIDLCNLRWWGFLTGPLAIVAGIIIIVNAVTSAPYTMGLGVDHAIGLGIGLIAAGTLALGLSINYTWRYGPAYAAHGFLRAERAERPQAGVVAVQRPRTP